MNEYTMKLHCFKCDNDVEVTDSEISTEITHKGTIDLQIDCPTCFELLGYHVIPADDICLDGQ